LGIEASSRSAEWRARTRPGIKNSKRANAAPNQAELVGPLPRSHLIANDDAARSGPAPATWLG
jgi:hypothetical protein